jgi:DNA-binding transcriptional MerR regulator/effector-binding domain-containing protein
MDALVTIGEFSRLTHLSVKTLRYYHDVGLLEPADVDPRSGYRMYATAQVPTAQLILRFRDLDMPIDEVRVVLDAPDVAARDRAILGHLERMEGELGRTQTTVASLRALLAQSQPPSLSVEYRSIGWLPALAVWEGVGWDDAEPWLDTAFADIAAVLSAHGTEPVGPAGALYADEFFEVRTGDVVAFVPIASDAALPDELTGRVQRFDVPAADLAVAMHSGPFSELDRTYGALGSYVAEHARVVEGPIREHYLVTADDTDDPAEYRTEVCWPVAPRR